MKTGNKENKIESSNGMPNTALSSLGGHSTTRGSKGIKDICFLDPRFRKDDKKEGLNSRIRRNDHKGKSETGRSMVEMLGVLAVIGVISIGGIVGYNLAMTKHRVNELLDGASKRAMAVSTQMMLSAPTNLDEFTEYNATSGGTFSGAVAELNNEQFAILVGDVSKETCIGLIKSIGDKTPLRNITTQADTATPLTAENCLDENNQLALIFNKDMKNKATTDNEQSGGGNADSSSSSGADQPEYPAWEPKECETTADCGPCEQCMPWGECEKIQTEECPCSSNEMSVIAEEGKMCIPCSYPFGFPTDFTEDCGKCRNREVWTNSFGEQLCTLICADGYEKNNLGDCLERCPDGYIRNSSEECIPDCSGYPGTSGSNSGGSVADKPECKCPEGSIWNTDSSSCICADDYFLNDSGDCVSCGSSSNITATAEECAKCGNREIWVDTKGSQYCSLSCKARYGEGDYFRNDQNICYPCDHKSTTFFTSTSECEKCSNREIYDHEGYALCGSKFCPSGQYRDTVGNCHDCTDTSFDRTTSEECHKCDNRYLDLNKDCRLCTSTYSGYATSAECARCSNRKMSGDKCIRK